MIDEIEDVQEDIAEVKHLDDFNSSHDYFAWANNQPYLTPEEEKALFCRLAANENDTIAHTKVFNAFMRLVISQARKYAGYKLPIEDLIQEGCIGLLKAIRGFDSSKNAKFAAYAIPYISSQILEFAVRNTSMVKMATTKEDRKLFFNMKRLNFELHKDKEYSKSLSSEHVTYIAETLNVSEDQVREMEIRLSGNELSKYDRVSYSGDNTSEDADYIDVLDLVEDEASTPEAILERAQEEYIRSKLFVDAVAKLNEREQRILNTRWAVDDKMTLSQLGSEFGVSVERVRQLEANAIKKIKASIQPFCKF